MAKKGLIIALTASAMADDVQKSLEAGCDFFVSKPIEPDFESQLLEKLEFYHGQNFSDR